MKALLLVCILIAFARVACGADSFPDWAWTLNTYTVPFRSSPISWGPGIPPGSAATVSADIVTESQAERSADRLPTYGLYGKGWPSTTQLDPSKYIEFGINFPGGSPLYIGYVNLPMFREAPTLTTLPPYFGEHGPRRWILRWSRDNFSSNLGPEFDMSAVNDRSEALYRVELWHHPPITEAVTFRVYGYDSPSSEGAGGLIVRGYKLYISGGTRPPLFGILPRATEFSIYGSPDTKGFFRFEGSYGSVFGLEKSGNLQTWTPAGVPDVVVNRIDNLGTFGGIPLILEEGQGYFRVIQR